MERLRLGWPGKICRKELGQRSLPSVADLGTRVQAMWTKNRSSQTRGRGPLVRSGPPNHGAPNGRVSQVSTPSFVLVGLLVAVDLGGLVIIRHRLGIPIHIISPHGRQPGRAAWHLKIGAWPRAAHGTIIDPCSPWTDPARLVGTVGCEGPVGLGPPPAADNGFREQINWSPRRAVGWARPSGFVM